MIENVLNKEGKRDLDHLNNTATKTGRQPS